MWCLILLVKLLAQEMGSLTGKKTSSKAFVSSNENDKWITEILSQDFGQEVKRQKTTHWKFLN